MFISANSSFLQHKSFSHNPSIRMIKKSRKVKQIPKVIEKLNITAEVTCNDNILAHPIYMSSFKILKKHRKILKDPPSAFNPDLTTSYLRIASIQMPELHQKSKSIHSFLGIVAESKRIFSKFNENTNELRSSNNELNRIGNGKLKFFIYPGNNSEVIRSIMLKKRDWEESSVIDLNKCSFIWSPCSKNVRFNRLLPYLQTQIANHFEYHGELTNKSSLYANMFRLCNEKSLNISEIIPKTFVLDFENKAFHSQVTQFVCLFKHMKKQNLGNLWIFKPSDLNRGKEIQVFNSLKRFKELLEAAIKKKNELHSVIVQKYIENPLLINQRKFDIRIWVLVTHEYKCYCCREGYIRTSSEEFSVDDADVDNKYIHLTNNAVQRLGSTYGKYEDGNQLPLSDLAKVLPEGLNNSYIAVIKRIKEIIALTFLSAKNKLNPNKRQYCFELIGYDFIVDDEAKVWLIECNTNPCLEPSSRLLRRIIPVMADAMIKITVDKIFGEKKGECQIWEQIA